MVTSPPLVRAWVAMQGTPSGPLPAVCNHGPRGEGKEGHCLPVTAVVFLGEPFGRRKSAVSAAGVRGGLREGQWELVFKSLLHGGCFYLINLFSLFN